MKMTSGRGAQPEPATEASEDANDGIWIGVDVGTSNCASAVWDATRGGAKWMRLATIAHPDGVKHGRIVPSAVLVTGGDDDDGGDWRMSYEVPSLEDRFKALVGASAVVKHRAESSSASASSTHPPPTLIRSVKRILGEKIDDIDKHMMASLPYEIVESKDQVQLRVQVRTSSHDADDDENSSVVLTPLQVIAALLSAIRIESERYLRKVASKKRMHVPGLGHGSRAQVRHAVIGVPAHFSSAHRSLVVEAARLAGFDGKVTTMVESTAAALAYGLSFNYSAENDGTTILVLDMGGGTTDVTICTRQAQSSSFEVAVTQGDGRLGGDDIDQLIAAYVLEKLGLYDSPVSDSLLHSCRAAKEVLCSNTVQSVDVSVSKEQTVMLSLSDVEEAMQSWLERSSSLILMAVRRYRHEHLIDGDDDDDDEHDEHVDTRCIHEVILVGGTTRIPAVRRMLLDENDLDKSLFGHVPELCTSLDPMASVAQGLAVQAALRSGLVPEHELRSALMLDSLPHAIGVDVGTDPEASPSIENFRCLLPKNSKLPARGHMTFQLANSMQSGVTVRAVELVDEDADGTLMPLGSFNFLLRRLAETDGARTLQVGMMIDTDGALTVSIFDEKDPEQVFKRKKFLERQVNGKHDDQSTLSSDLGYIADLFLASTKKPDGESDDLSAKDTLLLGSICVSLVVLYIGIKLMFAEIPPGEDAARIL